MVISAVVLAIRSWYRRRLERIQRRAMGKVTASLLHQIKNPLQTVLLHAEILADQAMASDPESRQDICDAIIGEATRVVDLLGELSIFASDLSEQLSVEEVPLHELVVHLTEEAATRFEPLGVTIERLPLEEVYIEGDSTFLKEALSYLIENASEALVKGGIRAAPRLGISLRRGWGRALIDVIDNGPGIEKSSGLDDPFRPFVTSKGTGLGLGLPLAREIIEIHGGRLTLLSRRGGGTIARTILPLDSGDQRDG